MSTNRISSLLTGVLALFAAASAMAFPSPPSPVLYNPITKTVEGDQPLSFTYTVTVGAPAALPLVSTPVTLRVTSVTRPDGVSEAKALSYVTLSPSTLTFTGPLQSFPVTVSVNVPMGDVAGDFSYRINTDGWPVVPGATLVDDATFINMHVQAPLTQASPPSVTITTPEDASTYTYTLGSEPLLIPFHFDATSDPTAPITSISADISGTPVTLAPPVGIGSGVVAGDGVLRITQPGLYVVTASATNVAGTSIDATQFMVNAVVPPPTVTITQPPAATYTLVAGGAAVNIPFTFVGKSFQGGISELTATLDGEPIAFSASGMGSLTATGNGTIQISTESEGDHELVVTAADANGSDVDSTSFTISVINPPPTVTITKPTEGQLFTMSSSATSLSIPYTFNTVIASGGKITAVSASLNGTTVTASSTGLGTASVSSSGTLVVTGPGNYTLTATGTSAGGVTDTDVVNFTVKRSTVTTPPTVTIDKPTANSTYTYVQGAPALNIPLVFTGRSTSAVITSLTAKLDGVALSVTPSNLGKATAVGTATLVVTKAGQHQISVTATDANGVASATRTFCVTVVNPTPRLTITNPDNCAEFKLPSSSTTLTIPFSFQSTISSGATIKSISAKLGSSALAITASGLNTSTATGTGSIKVTAAGTYTVTATATSVGGVTVTKSVKFTVKATGPVCKVVWLTPISLGKQWKCKDGPIPIQFQVQRSSGSGNPYGARCEDDDDDKGYVKDSSVKVVVYEIYSNGSCSSPQYYTYSGSSYNGGYNYGINTSGNPYKLNHSVSNGNRRYHVEVFYCPKGSNQARSLGSKEFTSGN